MKNPTPPQPGMMLSADRQHWVGAPICTFDGLTEMEAEAVLAAFPHLEGRMNKTIPKVFRPRTEQFKDHGIEKMIDLLTEQVQLRLPREVKLNPKTRKKIINWGGAYTTTRANASHRRVSIPTELGEQITLINRLIRQTMELPAPPVEVRVLGAWASVIPNDIRAFPSTSLGDFRKQLRVGLSEWTKSKI